MAGWKPEPVPNTLPPLLIHCQTMDEVPDTAGVYWFFGDSGIPLYIGKSIHMQSRLKSHFSSRHQDPKEARLFSRVREFGYESCPGDLGAQLLEALRIKQYQPLYNQRLRRRRKLAVLRAETPGNSPYLNLLWEDSLAPNPHQKELLCVFPTRRQGLAQVENWIREFGLCRRVLGLEKGRGPCFQRQLKRCKGACEDVHDAAEFNRTLTECMEKSSVYWPYQGLVGIQETCNLTTLSMTYWIQNWCLLDITEVRSPPAQNAPLPFDLDTCRILQRILNQGNVLNRDGGRIIFECS